MTRAGDSAGERVFVAMSGGVDSSVAAALLLEQGARVTGVTLELHADSEGACCTAEAARDAAHVCRTLSIEHVSLDARSIFDREVVSPFADDYAEGRTPNPCVTCNDRVKFGTLLEWVREQGGDALATGHYARVVQRDGEPWVARGLDAGKDQSYFLYRLGPDRIARFRFPLGELHKSDVRAYADRIGLVTARRPESQEVCFAPAGEHAELVGERRPDALRPGEIVDESGNVVGAHTGLAAYTVGQRRGLGIAAPQPLYVVAIDAAQNRVIVGPRESLRVSSVAAAGPLWRGGPRERVRAAVRYRMAPHPATATFDEGSLEVAFDEPLEGVAPGQAVVCYVDDIVIGGGTVAWAA